MEMSLQRPINLVLDWDATLITGNPGPLLSHVAKARDVRLYQYSHVDPDCPRWNNLLDQNGLAYETHLSSYFGPTDCVNDESYCEWLSSLKPVRMLDTMRISADKYFEGVTYKDVQFAAGYAVGTQKVKLRPGWLKLFDLFTPQEHGADILRQSSISVVSTHYSETYIRWCIWEAAFLEAQERGGHPKPELLYLINSMRICANEIDGLGSPEGSPGEVSSMMVCADDKEACLPASVKHGVPGWNFMPLYRHDWTVPEQTPWLVYVGSRETDYKCLKAADAGIWLTQSPVTHTREAYLNTFKPLSLPHKWPMAMPGFMGNFDWNGDFFWARTLDQVTYYLSRLTPMHGQPSPWPPHPAPLPTPPPSEAPSTLGTALPSKSAFPSEALLPQGAPQAAQMPLSISTLPWLSQPFSWDEESLPDV